MWGGSYSFRWKEPETCLSSQSPLVKLLVGVDFANDHEMANDNSVQFKQNTENAFGIFFPFRQAMFHLFCIVIGRSGTENKREPGDVSKWKIVLVTILC